MPMQPAGLPTGINITGRYVCNTGLTGTTDRTEVSLMYNVHTGSVVGLPANATRYSFGFNMGWRNIEHTRQGVFNWEADMRNKNHYPALTNPLFLLQNGDLASVRVRSSADGYRIDEADIASIVIFSRTGAFHTPYGLHGQLNEQLKKAWKSNVNGYEREGNMFF
ncbi:hypothetical protein GCM10023093_31150 [Nemorincola caseinilytica]|uniref:Uncharacterized protein n=1 Tax=Nemorincola caseinilytica TaxID=2054315 RepID=A0ABP8NRR7_9BACT